MKSEHSISATGRRPFIAIPIAIPTIPTSFSGVSITRSGPNRWSNPSVARKTPPPRPMSSPRTQTDGSRAISVASASLIALISVTSAIASPLPGEQGVALLGEVPWDFRVDILEHAGQRNGGGALRRLDRGAYALLRSRLLRGRVLEQAPPLEERGEPPDRVLPAPPRHLLVRPVDRRVVGGRVRPEAIRERLDQRAPLPGPRTVHRVPDDLADRQHVVAVDADTGKAVRRGLLRERPGGRLMLHGEGDGVPVVLAEEDDRQPEDPGEVHRRVEIPRGGPPVPEGGEHGDPLSAELRRVGRPDGMGKLRGHRGGDRYQVDGAVAPMVRHLPAPRRVRRVPEDLADQGGERVPPHQPHPVVPVRRKDPVPLAHGVPRTDGTRLLAGRRDEEADPAGTLKGDRLLVDRPQQHHMPVKSQQLRIGQSRIVRRVDGSVRSNDRQDLRIRHDVLPSPHWRAVPALRRLTASG